MKLFNRKLKSNNQDILKDIEFIKEQIEINKIGIDSLEKYGANTKYLKEQHIRYLSILNTLENSLKNA